ncbi:hypothetical protein J31TS4_40240 [Paenibacillus sp. J31TS4]|uniref:DUF456 domain-containing protein n=1 Tax=Paenibacillus sp. J31TS4 TaxID=2807195 RepID=UPI001B0CE5B0|nr:DUF456 domain-containing protein [Paenibacillus sp. J31TS4]GIP40744.1 hypothetical protein J31TS4_40240 [Paenibacillus sp. J31TS4]
MVWIGWILVIALFVIGMLGAVLPVLPGVLAIFAAFFVYGLFISFEPFGLWFWLIQSAIVLTVLIADYLIGAMGVKRFGGTRASVIGSTIGIIAGPFVIPAFGLIIGPFLGAVIGELLTGASPERAFKAGIGAVVGFFSSSAAKLLLQAVMIVLFFIWVW